MLRPTLQDVLEIAERGEGNLVPIYREVPADLETPVSAYLKVAEAPYSFLLESVEGGERLARYSFIGTNPYRVLRSGPNESWKGDPLVPLENELNPIRYVRMPNLPALTGGAIGYVSYDAVRHWEPKMERPQADPLELPESMFLLCDSMVVFDHIHHTMKVVAHVRLDGDVAAS
ncbi:MAG: anthranilate synthase component I, partial [Dehalococcoidia bacterium]|nr:anthranilate synthase component I [Dehalococcoidia bacterium]